MEKDYRKMVELIGGETIIINPENTTTLNPLIISINDSRGTN
ncbi:hypothetical protein P4J60_17845 [Bacillus cereus]|nr:hypothetical protein [Bacillus cereus]MEB9569102.1 hypothetical protein [Bacillus cereus]